jgi:hypothetical protein
MVLLLYYYLLWSNINFSFLSAGKSTGEKSEMVIECDFAYPTFDIMFHKLLGRSLTRSGTGPQRWNFLKLRGAFRVTFIVKSLMMSVSPPVPSKY